MMYLKSLIIIPTFMIFAQAVNAQYYRPEVEESQVRFDFLYPGVTWELKLSAFQTLLINPGLGVGLYPNPDIETADIAFGLAPFVDLQYRWYYDLVKRKGRGKAFAYNTGNFFAIKALVIAPTLAGEGNQDVAMVSGPVWGMQRTLSSGLSWGVEAGAGYFYGETYRGISPIVSLVIGFVPIKQR